MDTFRLKLDGGAVIVFESETDSVRFRSELEAMRAGHIFDLIYLTTDDAFENGQIRQLLEQAEGLEGKVLVVSAPRGQLTGFFVGEDLSSANSCEGVEVVSTKAEASD